MTDASLQKIAATYGTPTFVFDTDALQARVKEGVYGLLGPNGAGKSTFAIPSKPTHFCCLP